MFAKSILISFAGLTILLLSCGTEEETAEVKYRSWTNKTISNFHNCTFLKVLQPAIKVCVKGPALFSYTYNDYNDYFANDDTTNEYPNETVAAKAKSFKNNGRQKIQYYNNSNQKNVTYVKQPTSNQNTSERKGHSKVQIQDYTARAIRAWINAFKAQVPEATNNIDFTCSNPDLTVNVDNKWAMAKPGSIMHLSTTDDYGVILHELGHAFMCLDDTYINGRARDCRQGQPQSIMCCNYLNRDSENFPMLWEDDILGARNQVSEHLELIENNRATQI